MTGDAIIATLALGGVCLLMWWLARLAKKRMGVGAGTIAGDGLRVVGKRPLDQKNALYVIEIAGGRHILVGASAEGGGISKVDDISSDEYDAMMADQAPAASKLPKLRLARSTKSTDSPHVVSVDADEAATTDTDDAAETTPQFATVGESFGMLLGKARESRSARRDKRASGE
jgi:flagellar biogenesis protein FliO